MRNFSWGSAIDSPIQRKEREERKKDEREKPLLFKRHKVERKRKCFRISTRICIGH